jgi:hypothetical protein
MRQKIDASLFAHIENDAHLTGTYKLEGNNFDVTVPYLQRFLSLIDELAQNKANTASYPQETLNYLQEALKRSKLTDNTALLKDYERIMDDCQELAETHKLLETIKPPHHEQGLSDVSKGKQKKLLSLKPGEKLTLPGGWQNLDGGHAMVYQFEATPDGGYFFHIINTGSGISHHFQKSSTEKELFNPVKTFKIPPVTNKDELGFFIKRLMKPCVNPDQEAFSADDIYNQVIPSISFLKGELVKPQQLGKHAYFGGQLSGTCSMRCLVQMLKMNTPDEREFQRFIFQFKMFALHEYLHECTQDLLNFTEDTEEQITLAIQNNLKILNIPKAFSHEEIAYYKSTLENAQTLLTELSDKAKKMAAQAPPKAQEPSLAVPKLMIQTSISLQSKRQPKSHYAKETTQPNPDTELLSCARLSPVLFEVQRMTNPAAQFNALQQVVLQLPLKGFGQEQGFYSTLIVRDGNYSIDKTKTLEKLMEFQSHVDHIQSTLLKIRNGWMTQKQNAAYNITSLCVLRLQIGVEEEIRTLKGMPRFTEFTDAIMRSYLESNQRDPHWATNNPQLDLKFKELNTLYQHWPHSTDRDYFNYFKKLFEGYPNEIRALSLEYRTKYSSDTSKRHQEIRNLGLEALHMLSEKMTSSEAQYKPLLDILRGHLEYETKIRKAINPFRATEIYADEKYFELNLMHDKLVVKTCLYPTFVGWQESAVLTGVKYNTLEESSAQKALKESVSPLPIYSHRREKPISANGVQLRPEGEKTSQRLISQKDIADRDYFHLRANPALQIRLTLDYYARNLSKLAQKSDQIYLEANLFQQGLLLEEAKKPDFLQQWDSFLKKAERFHTINGEHTEKSLFLVRLNFLITRYLWENKETPIPEMEGRFLKVQEELRKQLSAKPNPDVTYVLHQYLFLSLVTQMKHKTEPSTLLSEALNSYFYLQSHTNPQILEDTDHARALEEAFAYFKGVLHAQPQQNIAKSVMLNFPNSFAKDGNYFLTNPRTQRAEEINVFQGKLFDGNLASSGVPLHVREHPLMKKLGLGHIRDCMMSADGQYMVLQTPIGEVRLNSPNPDTLTVVQEWKVGQHIEAYELQALSHWHLAAAANLSCPIVKSNAQAILKDNSMEFWQSTSDPTKGLLSKNNKPLYLIQNGKIFLLDEQGLKTPYQLKPLTPLEHKLLGRFESHEFIVSHQSDAQGIYELPRYNLSFTLDKKSPNAHLISTEKGETLVEDPAQKLNPKLVAQVAGLVLESDSGHTRFLVPVQRFYAATSDAKQGGFYEGIHDKENLVAQRAWQSQQELTRTTSKLMWDFQGSEEYVSFPLHQNEPVPNSVADALYLAYIYLATNQTDKAWKTLEKCTTEFGVLTGDPKELQYIRWICNDVLHVFPQNKGKDQVDKPKRRTPAYITCQMKALSLLTNFLEQGNHFDFKEPTSNSQSIHDEYEKSNQDEQRKMLDGLVGTVEETYNTFLTMTRYRARRFELSSNEHFKEACYSLLKFVHKDNPPKGALGYEWVQAQRDKLLDEERRFQALIQSGQPLSKAQQERHDLIRQRLNSQTNAMAKSTELEAVRVDVSVAPETELFEYLMDLKAQRYFDGWKTNLPGAPLSNEELKKALGQLNSDLSEAGFMRIFPALVQIAIKGGPEKDQLTVFLEHTLLANYKMSLESPESNIPLLCRLLYTRSPKNLGSSFSITDLIKAPQTLAFHNLSVLQVKNVYKDIMPAEGSLEEARANPKLLKPLKVTALQENPNATLNSRLKSEALKALEKHRTKYQSAQEANKKALEQQTQKLKSTAYIESFAVEKEAGEALLALQKEVRQEAQALLDNKALTEELLTASQNEGAALKALAQAAWKSAIALANSGPEDDRALAWKIEQLARTRSVLDKTDLLRLYSRAQESYSIEWTGLSNANIQKLHELIHEALVLDIQEQSLALVHQKLSKAVQSNSSALAAEALDVLSRKDIPGLDEPALVLIQHEDKILLHERQEKALKALLAPGKDGKPFEQCIEKVIMGGGKSKVILPVLAQRKAQGDNLVVIEVPPALLKTNFVDLNRTSQRLYGKGAYLFDFSRDSDCTPERLEDIYNQLHEVINQRGYLVTTGEAIQSLELKYAELLLEEGEHSNEWKEQVQWCDKITKLFRHNADTIIDEVHQGLSVKKKLNYTLGAPKPLDPKLLKNALELYKLIDSSLLHEAPKRPLDFDWGPFRTELAQKLVANPTGPLAALMNKLGQDAAPTIVAYLTNQCTQMPELIEQASPEDKETLGFFKGELSDVLVETLCRPLNTKYGASHQSHLDPVERALAIPYSANNVPNERNRLGLEIEAINCTIQMMRLQGISRDLFVAQIAEWKAAARQEAFKTQKKTKDTEYAKGFKTLSGVELDEVDVDNEAQMKSLHERLRFDPSLITQLLLNKVLKQIKHDSTIIHSDAFNHADLYRTTQGVSGTPSNFTTFHKDLVYQQSASLGTDGFVIGLILDEEKATQQRACDFKTVAQFLEQTLTASKDRARCRAIIDMNATFTGINNSEVSKELALFIKAKGSSNKDPAFFTHRIKHVLFFNEHDVLCAREVDNPEKVLELGSSDKDEIKRRLGSSPEECFTYYDQAHTVGTDIKQQANAHALALVDEKVSLQGFLQGAMRMRELAQSQTIELIVPERIAHLTTQELINQMAANEQKDLFIDNLHAAKANMTNCIRRQLLDLIQAVPNHRPELKSRLTQAFKTFIVDSPSLKFSALYGGISTYTEAMAILEREKKALLEAWRRCVNQEAPSAEPFEELTLNVGQAKPIVLSVAPLKDQEPPTAQSLSFKGIEEEALIKKLDAIIKHAKPFLSERYKEPAGSISLEVQLQKQVQKMLELQMLNQCYDPKLSEAGIFNVDRYSSLDEVFRGERHKTWRSTLNRLFEDDKGLVPDVFSDQLGASANYRQTYVNQRRFMDGYIKPALVIWYYLDPQDTLYALVVTPQESEDIAQVILRHPNPRSWLSTTNDTVLIGKRPAQIMSSDSKDNKISAQYKTLREQVAFFNAEATSLLDPPSPLVWLNQQSEEKLTFMEQRILPYRATNLSDYEQLKVALTQSNTEGFEYIAAHPFEDLTQADWKSLLSEVNDVQAQKYKAMSEAFKYLNEYKDVPEPTLEDLREKFNLDLACLGYVRARLELMETLSLALERWQGRWLNASEVDYFSLLASPEHTVEKAALEKILGKTLESFLMEQGLTDTSTKEAVELAEMKLIEVLGDNPYMAKNRKSLDAISLAMAQKTQSANLLGILLDSASGSDDWLVQAVILNPKFHAALAPRVLTYPGILDAQSVEKLFEFCDTDEQRNALAERSDCPSSVLERFAALEHNSSAALLRVISHSNMSVSVAPYVLKHKNASLEVLQGLKDYLHNKGPTGKPGLMNLVEHMDRHLNGFSGSDEERAQWQMLEVDAIADYAAPSEGELYPLPEAFLAVLMDAAKETSSPPLLKRIAGVTELSEELVSLLLRKDPSDAMFDALLQTKTVLSEAVLRDWVKQINSPKRCEQFLKRSDVPKNILVDFLEDLKTQNQEDDCTKELLSKVLIHLYLSHKHLDPQLLHLAEHTEDRVHLWVLISGLTELPTELAVALSKNKLCDGVMPLRLIAKAKDKSEFRAFLVQGTLSLPVALKVIETIDSQPIISDSDYNTLFLLAQKAIENAKSAKGDPGTVFNWYNRAFMALSCLRRTKTFEGKYKELDDELAKIARPIRVRHLLVDLAGFENPSANLLEALIENPLSDESVLMSLLAPTNSQVTEKMLLGIKNPSSKVLALVMAHPSCTPEVLSALGAGAAVDVGVLLETAKRHQSLLTGVIHHPDFEPRHAEDVLTILKQNDFDPELVCALCEVLLESVDPSKSILAGRVLAETLSTFDQEMVKEKRDFFLQALAKKAWDSGTLNAVALFSHLSSETVDAILSNTELNEDVLASLLTHKEQEFSLQQLQAIWAHSQSASLWYVFLERQDTPLELLKQFVTAINAPYFLDKALKDPNMTDEVLLMAIKSSHIRSQTAQSLLETVSKSPLKYELIIALGERALSEKGEKWDQIASQAFLLAASNEHPSPEQKKAVSEGLQQLVSFKVQESQVLTEVAKHVDASDTALVTALLSNKRIGLDVEAVQALLKAKGSYEPKVLYDFIPECRTEEFISDLLARPEVDDGHLAQIVKSLNVRLNSELLLKIILHPKARFSAFNSVFNAMYLGPEHVIPILRFALVMDKRLLTPLARRILGKLERVNEGTEEADLWRQNLDALFASIDKEGAIDLLRQLTESYALKDLGLILSVVGKKGGGEVLHTLCSPLLIQSTPERTLEPLMDASIQLSKDQLFALACSIETKENISKVLSRPDMTPEIASMLFNKPTFNGQIDPNWKWLDKQTLFKTMESTQNYDAFMSLFNHPNLSQKDKVQWLAGLKKEQGKTPTSPEYLIDFHLQALKIKAIAHMISAPQAKNGDYERAAESAFKLYEALKEKAKHYVQLENPKKSDQTQFYDECKKCIKSAEPIINKHRGLKQKLTDILNVLAACLTLRFDKIGKRDWRYFQPKTDTTRTARKVLSDIKKLKVKDEGARKGNQGKKL